MSEKQVDTKLQFLLGYVAEYEIEDQIIDIKIEKGFDAAIEFLVDEGFSVNQAERILDYYSM